MKKNILLIVLCIISTLLHSQSTKISIYNELANAEHDLDSIKKLAAKSQKHIYIQIGGNWCSWCIKMHNFINNNSEIKSVLNSNYITYHLNYSTKNKKEKLIKKYKFPDRFGFPVLLILDDKGNLIHTQDSSYLEEGENYSKEKLIAFFKNWTRLAYNGK